MPLLLHKTIRWSKLERFIFVLETAHQYFYIFRNYLSAKLPVKFVYRTLERGWKKKLRVIVRFTLKLLKKNECDFRDPYQILWSTLTFKHATTCLTFLVRSLQWT
jgi:hypothetical protein